jgi:hypothetical protein
MQISTGIHKVALPHSGMTRLRSSHILPIGTRRGALLGLYAALHDSGIGGGIQVSAATAARRIVPPPEAD